MSPKDKAKELISKFTFLSFPESDSKFYNPKQCALIAINEIIESWNEDGNKRLDVGVINYWEKVKQELNNL